MNGRGVLALAAALAAFGPVRAEEPGAAFLTLGQGARAQGLSGAFTAVADDATALAWNPAGLAQLSGREVSAGHSVMAEEVRTHFLGYAHPVSWGVLGASVLHLSPGAIEGRDADRRATGAFRAEDTAVGLGAARRLGSWASAGLGLKFVRQSIAGEALQGPAVDAGILGHTPVPGLQWGAAVQNLGPALRDGSRTVPLPLTTSAGASWRAGKTATLAFESRYSVHTGRLQAAFGLEFSPASPLVLRAGYASTLAERSAGTLSNLARLTGGLGLRLGRYRLDYALIPTDTMGNAQHASFSARF